MSLTTLNEHQARHVSAWLELLVEQLTTEAAAYPDEVERTLEAITQIFDACGLTPRQPIERSRRVGALADAWLARIDDLRPRSLKAYGTVPSDGDALDARLDDLKRALLALRSVARRTSGR